MSSHFTRGLASAGVIGLGAGGLLVAGGAAAPALAFTGTCPTTAPASTLVANNVCEVRFTAPGTSTFVVPKGVTKLSAVLVGGGGGADGSSDGSLQYAGGGGAVVYLDSVSGTSVAVTVGAGGAPSTSETNATAGGDTTVGAATAGGGADGGSGDSGVGTGGTSGTTTANENDPCQLYPNPETIDSHRNGGGAQTAATDPCNPGVGFQIAQLPSLDAALWPVASLATTTYGSGGAVNLAPAPVVAPGIGGSISVGDGDAVPTAGSDGLVILRFAPPPPPKPELAATGLDANAVVPGLGALALGVGTVLLALSRRRARRV